MPQYGGLRESLNRCRLLRALDSLRRRLLKRGRSHGGMGVSKTPPPKKGMLAPGRKVGILVCAIIQLAHTSLGLKPKINFIEDTKIKLYTSATH